MADYRAWDICLESLKTHSIVLTMPKSLDKCLNLTSAVLRNYKAFFLALHSYAFPELARSFPTFTIYVTYISCTLLYSRAYTYLSPQMLRDNALRNFTERQVRLASESLHLAARKIANNSPLNDVANPLSG